MRTALPVVLALTTLGVAACGSSGASSASTSGAGTVQVTATDSTCALSHTALSAGTTTFAITNKGSRVTEVYVYAAGDKIVTEKENLAPGLKYQLTAQIEPGSYTVACKPGMVGSGIRTPITVSAASTASAGASADPAAAQAVADYRAYVQQQADALVPLVQQFAAAVQAGDVTRAKTLYAASRVPWETVEPVAEAFGDLDPEMDARQADLDPGQEWTGWHRIEQALWVGGSTTGLDAVASGLVAHAQELQQRVAGATMSVASIGNGAKELLDEVATRKITGEEEVFSHTDLVDFAANVAGARKAFEVLRPLVQAHDAALVGQLDTEFGDVEAALAGYRTPDGGYASYDTVDDTHRRDLARVVDALGAPLSQLTAAALGQTGTGS